MPRDKSARAGAASPGDRSGVVCKAQGLSGSPLGVQELLAELYRGHDAFLFASKYEAWVRR